MIYSRQVTVTASAVIEVFNEIGISPGRYGVTVQVLSGTSVYLVESSAGANPGPKISWAATQPGQPYQFYTNKDPVYLKNYDSSNQAVVCLALTEMP